MKKNDYMLKDGNNINSVCQKAIYTYGAEHQQVKAIEELGELIESMMMSVQNNINNVEEEIADVEIMICQLRKMYQVDPVNFEVVEGGLNSDKMYLIIELSKLVQAIPRSLIGDNHNVETQIINVERAINTIRNMFNMTLIDEIKIKKLERLAGFIW